MYSRSNLNAVEVLSHHPGACIELSLVVLRPPVVHIAVLVEQASLVVESVSHLMTYNHAYSAVVEGIVSTHVEERILQYAGREADLVAGRVVVRIHGLRSHVPLLLVYRFAEIGERVRLLELSSTLQIFVVRYLGINIQAGVITPLVGITDLDGDSIEFVDSFDLGIITHPVERLYTLSERGLQVMHESQHTLFVLLGEIFLNIHLSYSLAKCTVNDAYGTFPQR